MKYLTQADELQKMLKALTFHGDEAFCTTRLIATKFGKDHKDVMGKIRSFDSFEAMLRGGKVRPLILEYRGQKYDAYELDADAYAFTCLSFTGKKAEQFKWAILEALKISTLEAVTAKAIAKRNLSEPLWIEVRTEGKLAHRSYTDIINQFCLYAEDQRGNPYSIDKDGNPNNKPCPYYIHFQRVAYQKAGINFTKGLFPKRDTLMGTKLVRVKAVEFDIGNTITDLMSQGLHYKKIFKRVKE